jgi:glycosyltransferase involved in cell wall biosynthesis
MNDRKPEVGHILLIVENATVPLDIRVWREARTAKEAGFKVSVICPRARGTKYRKCYEVMEGIEIYRHPSYRHSGGIQKQALEYLNAFFWEIVLCLRIYIGKPFQVIHVANPPDNLFLIGMIFKILGVKLIFDHHDLFPELYLSKFGGGSKWVVGILRTFEKLSCLAADAIISTNESFKRHVTEEHGINPDKVFVVRNDPEISPQETCEKPRVTGNGERIKLIYVGVVNEQDGVGILVHAVNTLVRSLDCKFIKCLIVGDGTGLPEVKQLVINLGVQEYFEFTGFIYDRDVVKRYVQEADICVEPAQDSECNRKSTFIKIMEYMSCCKPVVAFDLDETRRSTGNTAVLVEPGNIRRFAEEICKLAKDRGKRELLGAMARERIVKQLNWGKSSTILKEVYMKLVSGAT